MSFVYIIFLGLQKKFHYSRFIFGCRRLMCSPVAGSVLLAGILLKLGGYGFLFSLGLFPIGAILFLFCFNIGFLAVIYGSLVTCRQVDLKRVVAYSSVAHMGVVVLGLFSLTSEVEIGGIYLMFAHGLVSPGYLLL